MFAYDSSWYCLNENSFVHYLTIVYFAELLPPFDFSLRFIKRKSNKAKGGKKLILFAHKRILVGQRKKWQRINFTNSNPIFRSAFLSDCLPTNPISYNLTRSILKAFFKFPKLIFVCWGSTPFSLKIYFHIQSKSNYGRNKRRKTSVFLFLFIVDT